jgi:Putative peptidoglycan binding domain
VRSRRITDDRLRVRAVAGGAFASRLWSKATRRPVDSIALLAAVAASFIIIVNAIFLQSGSRAAPFFANPRTSQVVGSDTLKPADTTVPLRPVAAPMTLQSTPQSVTPQPVAARRDDPIADLIGPAPRTAAVQRALSDYGYGQLKPSGMFDDNTSAAIEKFEREHKLPVTGQISDRLVDELGAMVGHPLQ